MLQHASMERKQIVIAYIKHQEKFLLVKRSAWVNSFKHQWSAITGRIEMHEDALHSALREIEEETGLSEDQVVLIKRGIAFEAKMKDKVRIIHPFLFATEIDSVTLNWENSDYLWVSPDQMKNVETVEGVGSTLINLIHE